MKHNKIFLISFLVFAFFSCQNRETLIDKNKAVGSDYRLFQGTPAWDLAKAVWDEDVSKIKEIISKDKELINFKDDVYGKTLLMLTISNQQYKSFKTLIEQGAYVNMHDRYSGSSALIQACRFKHYDDKFVEFLLQNGANVNDVEIGERKEWNGTRDTPLIAASESGKLSLVKLLVKNNANINYQNEYKHSALSRATILGNYNIVLFFLNNGIDFKLPITYNKEQNKIYYLVDKMRFYMPKLNSKKYKIKMEIVSFLRSKGIEYKNVPIPAYVKRKAKEKYPNSWEEYLEKY